MKMPFWECGWPPPVPVPIDPVGSLPPAWTGRLFARFLTHEGRLRLILNLAASILNRYPRASATFPEPLDLCESLYLRYLEGARNYRHAHALLDLGRVPWLGFVYFRLVGTMTMGAMQGIAKGAHERESRYFVASASAGPDSSEDEDEQVDDVPEDDDQVLSSTIRARLPRLLTLVRAAVDECAKRGAFTPHDKFAVPVFDALYIQGQNMNDASRTTGAPPAFVRQMADPAWAFAKLLEYCPECVERINDAWLRRSPSR